MQERQPLMPHSVGHAERFQVERLSNKRGPHSPISVAAEASERAELHEENSQLIAGDTPRTSARTKHAGYPQ